MTRDDRPAILAAEGLVRAYDGRRVVDVARLHVARGEVLAVLGPNGAGKSTLFRLLLLLEQPDEGVVLLGGKASGPGDRSARRRLAGVFQRPHLFAGTVRDNLEFGLRGTAVPESERRERATRVAGELGLGALMDANVRILSGGEAQRVALGRALVLKPDVLVLDEPTAGLDVTIRRRFREELSRLIRDPSRGVILITHDAADAFELADRVAVMEAGRIVQVGTPEDLTMEPATPFVATFTGAELLLDGVVEDGSTGDGTARVRAGGESLVVRCAGEALAPGERVHVRYRPEDVLLAPAPDTETGQLSARNHLAVTVRSMTPAGGLIRVRLTGPPDLAALVTRDSAERLGLAVGQRATALLKTSALIAYRTGSSG